MKSLFLSIFLFISVILFAESIPKEELLRIELIADQMYADQSATWYDLNWKSGPLIVTFPNGHIYAFSLKTQDPSWKELSSNKGPILFTTEDKWGVSDLHMQAEFEIEGQTAFVYKMNISPSSMQDVTLLAHERFHRHQDESFVMKEGQGLSIDHLSEENLTWTEIEDQLLRDFLNSGNEEKMEHLKDYIAVNQMRREAIDPLTKQWENGQLRMEGLADYAAAAAYGGESMLLAMHPEEEHDDDFIDQAIKWRHYMAGAALGFALNYVGAVGWQKRVQQGESLPDILYKSMPISRPEQEKRIKKVQARLNYKKRRKLVKDKVDRYFRHVDELHGKYEKVDGVKLFLGRPPISISGGGANDEMVYLDEGSIVALNDTSTATTSDGKWSFKTREISHLFQHMHGVREVKIDKDAAIQIDQMSFSVNELIQERREYPFRHLKIDCKDSSLDSGDHVGVLIVDENGVHVRYF